MKAERVLLLFVDGVGLGDDADYNPFTHASLPTLHSLLGTLPVRGAVATADGASLHALDATFGVDGLPQSGTGQAALFTGEDAVALHGRHFGPWVPTTLRAMLAERNLLVRAQQAGRSVAFANAYPEELVARVQDQTRRVPAFLRAGPPLVALAAGVLTRHTAALIRGDAVASEITNEGWRERLRRDVPVIAPEAAGANLAGITGQHDLTLYAHYATDTVGHLRALGPAVSVLERVDGLLRGVLDHLSAGTTVVIASDHGNIEDIRAQHTRNPALGMVIGPGAENASLNALTDVAPFVLGLLGV